MNKFFMGIAYCLLMAPGFANAQVSKMFGAADIIVPYRLQITNAKTTIILFPCAIKSVDRGSATVLAEKVKEADNVLKLKASQAGLPESNLSVITADGQLFSFIVDDVDDLPYQAIDLRKQGTIANGPVQFNADSLNDVQIQHIANGLQNHDGFLHCSVRADKIKVKLEGIYMNGGVMFYQFRVRNRSNLDYALNFSRFYVRDSKKIKRMAIQEYEIDPLYMPGNIIIKGQTQRVLVFAFKQFTIADDKKLAIEFYERNGDRNPALSIDGKELLKAKSL
ncbi:MAG: conjugative transposon protein TraN [Bacteroidetes bacterium]|nr:conjugative transposon protein TraN [Bacteroidota bacterium]